MADETPGTPHPVDSEAGQHLREARTAAGLTQLALAARTDLSRASIANMEAGRQPISLRLAARFADVLNVDAAALVGESVAPLALLSAVLDGQRQMADLHRRAIALLHESAEVGRRITSTLDEWE